MLKLRPIPIRRIPRFTIDEHIKWDDAACVTRAKIWDIVDDKTRVGHITSRIEETIEELI